MTLESKIQERAKAIAAEKAAQQKEALTADQQAQKEFEAANQKLVQLVKSIGAKGEIVTPKYGESSVPYAAFTVLEVPCAIEDRYGILELLVNGAKLPDNSGFLGTHDEDTKLNLETILTSSVAQVVHDRAAQAPTTDA